MLLAVGGALGCLDIGGAWANDACKVVSGTTVYQCTGNQSSPVTVPGAVPSTATGIVVTDLTTNVPYVFVNLPDSFTGSFATTFSDPTHTITPSPNAYASAIGVKALNQTFNWWSGYPAPVPTLSVVVNGSITASGSGLEGAFPAIYVTSTGEKGSSGSGDGGGGHAGLFPENLSLTLGAAVGDDPAIGGDISMGGAATLPATPVIDIESVGGSGGSGANGSFYSGGNGGSGTTGGAISGTIEKSWTLNGLQIGALLYSQGGSGGGGGYGSFAEGGSGGPGGNGGVIGVSAGSQTAVTITTLLDDSPGIALLSQGGNGGHGGAGETFGDGGRGGAGGFGGAVTASGGIWNITTEGADSAGFGAYSLGGIGGDGGDGGFFDGSGGAGANSGGAGPVTVSNQGGQILTLGADSPGIIAQSIAGHGGASGNESGLVSFSASGGSAGYGNNVTVESDATVTTISDSSPAISAQSIGGGGGSGGGGFGAFYAAGGSGGNGGGASAVTVFSDGPLTTSGADSSAIYAQSIGGSGGDGGSNGSLIESIGGSGAAASDGGAVTVDASGTIITGATAGDPIQKSEYPVCGVGCSSGILAQSIGGGGGYGGGSGGWFSLGGTGGGGGNGSMVSVALDLGSIDTRLATSDGILAQSIGGGGGDGGNVTSAGLGLSAAVGGSGGGGGTGGQAQVLLFSLGGTEQPIVTTQGDTSPGIVVQSLGGGGGNGGWAADLTASPYASISVAIGGTGGSGGGASTATYTNQSDPQDCCNFVSTLGDNSPGIQVQSIGGGGGNGGWAVSASGTSEGLAASFAMGGGGGGGGNGGVASAWSNTWVSTAGASSPGLQVQSIGGGGGDGGFSIAATLATGDSVSAAVAVGGSGGNGGDAGGADVTNSGAITTRGPYSDGLVAQSLGGGGGNGGLTVAGSISIDPGANFGVSVGASGGNGGDSSTVFADNSGPIEATGANSRAIVAQSIGGGGGNGSTAVSGAIAFPGGGTAASFAVALGGKGGAAGNAGSVSVTNTGNLVTSSAANAADGTSAGGQGILAQSIGGGGGTGGWSGAGSFDFGTGGTASFGAALGASGGSGGSGYAVEVNHSGSITTYGPYSGAILASSIGGGGGDAGGIADLTLAGSPTGGGSVAGSVNIGQSGGGGGTANEVVVSSDGALTTSGLMSPAISAQSIGGGGGNAGYIAALTMALGSGSKALTTGVTLGGDGGSGRSAYYVTVTATGDLTTAGDNSPGIQALSIGGGGGNGSYAVALALSQPFSEMDSLGLSGALGGSGGTGALAGDVSVTNSGDISTGLLSADGTTVVSGSGSPGIIAESIGGGGGNAELTVTTAALVAVKAAVTVGGDGGSGGDGGTVTVANQGAITLVGNASAGIVARSIGGGGGASQATNVSVGSGDTSYSNKGAKIDVSIGNTGAGGNNAGPVTVTNSGAITTALTPSATPPPADPSLNYESPINSYGIFAQSVGGGGGMGGSGGALVPNFTASDTQINSSVTVGGKGGAGGTGDTVQVTNSGPVDTHQDESDGIYAQSVGGGGGKGGAATSITGFLSNDSNVGNIGIAVGGEGGTGNDAGPVTVTNTAEVDTYGTTANAIFAQSIGGGGGDGGSAAAYALGINADKATNWQATLNVAVGGSGGGTGSGSAVDLDNQAPIETYGDDAVGLFAQSVGGGGGTGGGASPLSMFPLSTLSISVGGSGGASGNGGAVSVDHKNFDLVTQGDNAPGIYAQSVGGGGGRGGVGIYVPLATIPWGGAGGSSGSGGPVNVYVAFASIATHGTGRSYGIFAQSVGGGGGESGGLGFGVIDTVYGDPPPTTVGIADGNDTAGNGNGSNVQVKLDYGSRVTTTGDDAIGIFAQSVGGGGGVTGLTSDQADSCQTDPCGYSVGPAGGTGDAGKVTVALLDGASVTTSGQYSHAIFAQSTAGNDGTAAGAEVDVNGSVSATGDGASGIFADVSSGGTNGPIAVSIDAGSSVSGGTGNASGIRLIDGTANTITNAGTLTSVGGASGAAIRTDRSDNVIDTVVTTVTNSGTIMGDLLAGNGTEIDANNEVGGTLDAGSRLILGEGGRLDNAGTLDIGGGRRIEHTVMLGNLVQESSGRMLVDLDPSLFGHGLAADLLTIAGSADLQGELVVRPLDFGPARTGRRTVTLIDATTGVSFDGLAVAPSAVAQYQLEPEAGGLALGYDIDFDNATVAGSLDSSQRAVAHYLEALHGADRVPADMLYLVGLGSAAEYGQALDRLSPEAYATNLRTVDLAATHFGDALLDCRGADTRVVTGHGCVAVGFGYWGGGGAGIDYDLGSRQATLTAERQISTDWAIGGGLGYEYLDSHAGTDIWNGNGRLWNAGLFARRGFGSFALTGAIFGGGIFSPSTTRYTTATTSTHGEQDLDYVGGMLRGERSFAALGGSIRAGVGLAVTQVSSDAFTETGSIGRLAVEDASETNTSLRPRAEWSTEIPLQSGYVLRPRVGLGVTTYLDNPSPSIDAAFVDSDGAAAPMQVSSNASRTYGDVDLGIDIEKSAGVTLGLTMTVETSGGSCDVGSGLQMSVLF